ncbi:MAG: hypothetical protein PHQ54_01840 [Candidatus Omnitrophica bacterium]|nr:hypothetical protein [Candidatus Omnitrophota bacterium]
MDKKGWVLVKLLVAVTAVLIFIYLMTPRMQGSIYKIRNLTTQANMESIRVAIASYYKDNAQWPPSLNSLMPKYFKKIPKEYLSSVKGSLMFSIAKKESDLASQRGPGLEGWIYGDFSKDESAKSSHVLLPRSTTLSDKTGDTSSW